MACHSCVVAQTPYAAVARADAPVCVQVGV